MTRKPPKRAGESCPPALTTQRLAELVEIIADPCYVVGPQDEIDIIEALRELVDRRNAERVIDEAIGRGTFTFKAVETGRGAA